MKLEATRSGLVHRRSRLAQALALALGIGATAMVPQVLAQTPAPVDRAMAEAMYQNHFGTLDGFDAYMTGLLPGSQSAGTNAVTATRYVTNCNDSGGGSFRSVVAAANSGDTIDLSACHNWIKLNSSVVTSVDDLIITSELTGGGVIQTGISGQGTIRPLAHTGTGTLTLENIAVRDGKLTNGVARGGCVSSLGNVQLIDAQVKYCEVSQTSGTNVVKGGAIYAAGNVTLQSSDVIQSKASSSVSGRQILGGGIYAKSIMAVNSTISGNSATTLNGVIKGGGIYLGGGSSLLVGSIVSGNKASTANNSVHTYGGGIFSKRTDLTVTNSTISGNVAKQYGEGGGIFVSSVEPGVTEIKYSNVDENEATLGGGIKSLAGLTLTSSTVAGNSATSHGGIHVNGGNIQITDSTISGNTAERVAGATLKASGGGDLTITQTTISGNETNLDPAAVSECPGTGLRVESNAVIHNSTIVFNMNDQGTTSNEFCAGLGLRIGNDLLVNAYSTLIAHNQWRYTTSSGDTKRGTENVYGTGLARLEGMFNATGNSAFMVPPDTVHILHDWDMLNYQVSPFLADNGGPTKTHMPFAGGLLIDAGTSMGLEFDQRGEGYPRVKGPQADIGSVERDLDDLIFKDGFE